MTERGEAAAGRNDHRFHGGARIGLGFAVRMDKPAAFIGREALVAARGRPLRRRLLAFALEDAEPLLYRDEPIWRDGALVGRITSGAYGHTVGRAVGLGYVTHADGVDGAFVGSGRWEIEIACDRVTRACGIRTSSPSTAPSRATARSESGWSSSTAAPCIRS